MTLLLVIFITGFMVTSSYAMWYKVLQINGTVDTGTVDWEFTAQPQCIDSGLDWNGNYSPYWDYYMVDKDVASCSVQYLDAHTMQFTINNAYPWYYEEISSHAIVTGSVPIKVWKVVINGVELYATNGSNNVFLDLNNDSLSDIVIRWNDNLGSQLHTNWTVEFSFWVVVLQEAPQNTSLTVTISIYAVQWNEYSVP